MRSGMNGEVRDRLRQLLMQRARPLGLTTTALEALLQAAELGRWPAGDEIVTSERDRERVAFVVVGAAKVVCETPRGKRVTVCFVPPGQFIAGDWFADAAASSAPLRAYAHDPLGTIVATWTPRVLLDVLIALSPPYAMQFVATASRAAVDLLRHKCHLLGLCLRDRVLAVLTTLARDFGRPHPDGVCIELRLTHHDVASAAVGSRANVTRALEELRAARLVAVERHRLVVTHHGLAALHTVERGEATRGFAVREHETIAVRDDVAAMA